VAGALAGVLLAVVSVLRAPAPVLPDGAVAVVNDVALSRDELLRSLEALAADRRTPLGEADRRFVLERMIDEELLVQRGLELGFARHDRKVRGDLVGAMLAAIAAEADSAVANDATLRRFYEEHREHFAKGARLRVQQVFVDQRSASDPAAGHRRASEASLAWRAGVPADEVRARYGDAEPAPLPDVPLGPAKLQDYLGPTATRTALSLPPGAVSDPVRSSLGWHVLRVLEQAPATTPPFEAIRREVETEWRRRRAEDALKTYLRDLRARARLVVAPGAP